MTTPASLPKIAVIVGSNRRESINRKLAQALVKLAGSKFEAKFVQIKPGLVDEHGNIGDESTKAFLQGFVDRFSTFVIRLTQHQQHNREELAVRH
jgi:NADPH-dependent FMN reductase